jgi:hypothetical protein
MKSLQILVLAALSLAACDDEPTHVFFEAPSDARLEGAWVGVEEIQTMQDSNVFSFPVLLTLDGSNRFTLFTTNYPASFDDVNDRTCSGSYTRRSNTLTFFPNTACRALPLTEFTLGRVLQTGVTMEARSNTSFANIKVVIRLDRD